jgi:cation diffusion facilitator CzcD-associated flavoprotein CzcO
MCAGKYGDVPRMPAFPPGRGPEVFRGQVMHSLDYCKLGEEETVELMRGKKVVVVGYKKSAIDLALECAQANQGTELLLLLLLHTGRQKTKAGVLHSMIQAKKSKSCCYKI